MEIKYIHERENPHKQSLYKQFKFWLSVCSFICVHILHVFIFTSMCMYAPVCVCSCMCIDVFMGIYM